jgi:hypothetical protein
MERVFGKFPNKNRVEKFVKLIIPIPSVGVALLFFCFTRSLFEIETKSVLCVFASVASDLAQLFGAVEPFKYLSMGHCAAQHSHIQCYSATGKQLLTLD